MVGRRTLLKSGAAAVLSAAAPSASWSAVGTAPGKTLVAYFSRTGNTKVVARQIGRAFNAQVFEINPAAHYPEDYDATVQQAKEESDRGYEPPLRQDVAGFESVKTAFLGFPIWGMTTPPVIRSFLSKHEWNGKTVIPFITHGGYGRGDTAQVLARLATGARILEGFLMQAPQERQTRDRVAQWLGTINVAP